MAISAEREQAFSLLWDGVYLAVLQAISTGPKLSVRTADQSTGRILEPVARELGVAVAQSA
jgi:hypothetical protein